MLLLAAWTVLHPPAQATDFLHVGSALFPRVGMQIRGKELRHRPSTEVPTFAAQEPHRAVGPLSAFDNLRH